MKEITITLRLFLVMTVLTGIVYPLLVTAVAQAAFSHKANGSLIQQNGNVLGSSLVGQSFTNPKFFWGRPSATSPNPYNAASSSGSNLGPTNPELIKLIQERITQLKEADPGNDRPVPTDLVTASASGLDPHISVAAAEYQIARIARLRNLPEAEVRDFVREHTVQPSLGFFGEPVVNVLELNLALDAK